MKPLDISLIGGLICALILGMLYQDDPYRLRGEGMPIDQMALEHRDSPYAHITWVVSEGNNYAELRFFDKVEGGVCLYPSWEQIAVRNANGTIGGIAANANGRLDHIAMPHDFDLSGAKPGRQWPAGRAKPNMGTVTKSPYVNLFPAGVLLNERLMSAAEGDPHRATPNILVVGLGSGVGIAVLAHHFPQASIAVVDIDAAVLRMVTDHYPFMRWLTTQTTADGRPRLKMDQEEVADARQYIRYEELRKDDGRKYDLVIVDAYTDGSTIPPHLMTKEFYENIRAIMPEDGIILSNIIGSYTGAQHRVVGGAMRSKLAAGLNHAFNLPIVHGDGTHAFDRPRNNILIASASPLDPASNRNGWERLNGFTPYSELPTRNFVSHQISLSDRNGLWIAAKVPLTVAADEDVLRRELRNLALRENQPESMMQFKTPDVSILNRARAIVRGQHPNALGWNREDAGIILVYEEVDWILFARANWTNTIREARKTLPGRSFVHEARTLIGDNGVGGTIPRVPLFTDAMPNADIFNR